MTAIIELSNARRAFDGGRIIAVDNVTLTITAAGAAWMPSDSLVIAKSRQSTN